MSRCTSPKVPFSVVVVCLWVSGCATAQPKPNSPSPDEMKRRELATKLRQRISNSRPGAPGFWNDVKTLESLYPPGIRVAVIKYPDSTVLYSYKNLNGLAVAEDHVVLGTIEQVQAEQAIARGDFPPNARFMVVNSDRGTWWTNGEIPFEVAGEMTAVARQAIQVAIDDYERLTPVRFRPRDGEQQYLRFEKHWLPGLSSMTVGIGGNGGLVPLKIQTDGPAGPFSQSSLEDTVRHELGHVLGLYHEHTRKDRDQFIRIDEACSSYDWWYAASGNYNIEENSKKLGPYDFRSIMHYPSIPGTKDTPAGSQPCFQMVKQPSMRASTDSVGVIASNSFLSKHDVNGLHHMYGRGGVHGRSGDGYGDVLLVHNFDCNTQNPPSGRDDYSDLVVGAPNARGGTGGVYLYKNTATGLVLWKFIAPPTTEAGQRFGAALAGGDFDGDGFQDLAVGAPRATVNGKASAGKVCIYRIRGNRDNELIETITKADIGGTVEVMDRFGAALSAGVFFDDASTDVVPRFDHLAIGAPGARRGAGRVGRVWVLDNELSKRFRNVETPGITLTKFGQFGYALVTLRHRVDGVRPHDRLVVAAPGVTLGGCGSPAIFRTADVGTNLSTVSLIPPPDATPPPAFCPQDPNLSDAIDAYPNPVWDASFGANMVSGDFTGDSFADLAVSGSTKVHVFLANVAGQLTFQGTVSNTDFGEPALQNSFGTALAAGDLNEDGRDDLIVGAPLTAAAGLQNVGKAYVFRGCIPGQRDRGDRFNPGVGPLAGYRQACEAGVKQWFTIAQTDFQSQDFRIPLGTGSLAGHGSAAQTVPMFPPFTENKAEDRFARAVAVIPAGEATKTSIMVGCLNKALPFKSPGGAVFRFQPSLTDDPPAYRNQSAITSDFTTSLRRD